MSEFEYTMTVKQLRDKLAEYPDDMPVITEGCDCEGNAGSLEVFVDGAGGPDYLLIRRASEKARLEQEQRDREEEARLEALAAEQRKRGLIA